MSEAERAREVVAGWTEDAKKHWTRRGRRTRQRRPRAPTSRPTRITATSNCRSTTRRSPKADSGIYLRGTPQVQIWDYTKEGGKWDLGADKGSGGLWNNTPGAPGKDPLVLADKPFGEWNTFRIIQVGARTTV